MTKDPVFKQHPSLVSYHETSDGVKFFKNSDAHTHARSLKDKSVKEVKNTDSVEIVDKPENKVKAPSNTKASKKSEKETGSKLEDLTPMQKANIAKKAIAKLETVEAVNEALKDETYPSVIKAGEERIKALEAKAKGENTNTEEEE